jgi:hypothetical protein
LNPKKYIDKAIHLSPPFGQKDTNQAAALVVRFGYPEPATGVTLIEGRRGDTNNGIDWALSHLQDYVEQLIHDVAEDCVNVINQDQDSDEESRKRLIQRVRDHFEIIVH